ncbi:MAG: MoaD/ThiS family protein [Myxococcales bacterium]|nr:MoaD/ThiS family protein [Myxococcales bacterium]
MQAGLDHLVARYPGLGEVLLDGKRQVRGVHKLFLDGEPLDSVNSAVRADSEVAVVTAIAGG